uniref:Glycosyltransferase 2-like domain-containing protein n=1 Tax=viral metagenome TaxID=1070528 RepID=A0A6C0APU1_9ZZZZ
MIQCNFVFDKTAPNTTVGLAEDLLKQLRATVNLAKARHYDLKEPLAFGDINIHVGIPSFGSIPWAHSNVLIKDEKAWSEEWNAYLPFFDGLVTVADLVAKKPELLVSMKALCDTAVKKRPTSGVVHCPPILRVEDCPPISVVTPTYNRRELIDIAFHNLMTTDYPKSKIEWIVIEDHEDSTQMASEKIVNFQVNNPEIQVKYVPIQGRMTIGQKRNIGVEHATNEIVLFMDDDDHYPVTSLRRRVAWLTKGYRNADSSMPDARASIAFCTTIALYDLVRGVSAVNVPPWGLGLGKRISEATFTFYKSAWLDRKFDDVSVAEGETWITGREGLCLEMPPQQVIVAFTHKGNSSGRRVPPADVKEIACFWGFPKEYLMFIHKLAGIEVEEEGKKVEKAKKNKLIKNA